MDKRYQVFVSSTFTDLKEERKAVIEGLLNAKYIPAGMEMFSASNDEQFKYIKKIIDTCDYYILIIGARYGSINSSTGKSFTEQEYDYAVEKNIPILAFLHADPYNLPYEKRDDKKRELLEKFREKVSKERLCKMWHTSGELISSVIISLNDEVVNNPQMGWTRNYRDNRVENEIEIERLRKENKMLNSKVKKMENAIKSPDINTDNEEKIKKLSFENKCLKADIERLSYLPKWAMQNISLTDKISINFLKDGKIGILYITWEEIFIKIGRILLIGCDINDFENILSDRLIFGEGRILKNDVNLIVECLIRNLLCLETENHLKLTRQGKTIIKSIMHDRPLD